MSVRVLAEIDGLDQPGDFVASATDDALLIRPLGAVERFVGRCLELLIASVGLVLMAVAMPFVALAIKLDSRGPVIYRQERVGLDGRVFTIYKLRTMVVGAEHQRDGLLPLNVTNGVTFKAIEDPRCTRTGRWLRRFSLDESPQFWNVIRGEMALVGPRPGLISEFEHLSPRERARCYVKPGITGMWQVKGRNLLDFSEMVELDLEYASRRSLGLDAGIILRTLPAMLRGRGAF